MPRHRARRNALTRGRGPLLAALLALTPSGLAYSQGPADASVSNSSAVAALPPAPDSDPPPSSTDAADAPAPAEQAALADDAGGEGQQPSSSAAQSGANPPAPPQNEEATQSKRIFWVIPNYRAVSADTHPPPLSGKRKFVLATQDSFDYSSFIVAALLAGWDQATKSTPQFHTGIGAYGQYYWHSFADQAVGNYFTEFLVPWPTREDPRYFTLGADHGRFFRRLGYALSRIVVTRTDSGGESFNFSEVVGNALGAGVSNAYYPAADRTLAKSADKWGTQLGADAIADILKEFWPDIRKRLVHESQ